jgi:hypothetical protein
LSGLGVILIFDEIEGKFEQPRYQIRLSIFLQPLLKALENLKMQKPKIDTWSRMIKPSQMTQG